MTDAGLLSKSATELGPLLKSRKLSPVELVRASLARMEAANPRVRAFLTVTAESALDNARRAEQEIARGRYRGPLHGIPYAPKDLIATKGVRTTNGSRATAHWVPDYDATVIARLAAAGAILVGKLNLLEFAMGSGQVGLEGPAARNPWDLRYSPSGSSSGSGAALAAGMVPLTLGTDSGGSIRGPAKSCGVVGLKPTLGRISRHGVTTLSWTLDHVGPMARTVADTAQLLRTIAGRDPQDRSACGAPVPDYTAEAIRRPAPSTSQPLRGLRLGIPKGTHFSTHVAPETAAALNQALRTLTGLGLEAVEVDIRDAELASPASAIILGAESAAFHRQRLAQHAGLLDPLVRERLEAGSLYSAVDYIQALRVRTRLTSEMRRVFRFCDLLFLPAGNAAPLLEDEIVQTDAPRVPPPPPRPDVLNLANVTGIPALVLPCGFTAGPPALPLGMQLCAAHFQEGALFRAGHFYQAATDWHRRPLPTPA